MNAHHVEEQDTARAKTFLKKVIAQRTYQDLALGGHRFATELQQAVQIAEVFGFSDQGQTLLQFPFSAARVALCNLRGKRRVHV